MAPTVRRNRDGSIDVRSSDERQAQIDEGRKARKEPGVEKLLRQFLTLESGMAQSAAFDRGYAFAFEFSPAAKEEVNKLMSEGVPFEDAFDAVKGKSR